MFTNLLLFLKKSDEKIIFPNRSDQTEPVSIVTVRSVLLLSSAAQT